MLPVLCRDSCGAGKAELYSELYSEFPPTRTCGAAELLSLLGVWGISQTIQSHHLLRNFWVILATRRDLFYLGCCLCSSLKEFCFPVKHPWEFSKHRGSDLNICFYHTINIITSLGTFPIVWQLSGIHLLTPKARKDQWMYSTSRLSRLQIYSKERKTLLVSTIT